MNCTVFIKTEHGRKIWHLYTEVFVMKNICILFLFRSGDDGYQPPGEQPLQPLPVPTVHFQCPEIIRTWIKELRQASAVIHNSDLQKYSKKSVPGVASYREFFIKILKHLSSSLENISRCFQWHFLQFSAAHPLRKYREHKYNSTFTLCIERGRGVGGEGPWEIIT